MVDQDESEIQLLAVHPEARGQGITSHLVSVCEQRAISNGDSKMVLSTQETMGEAHRLYKEIGYRRNFTRDRSKRGANKIFYVYEKALGK